jgi:hypothetical protein
MNLQLQLDRLNNNINMREKNSLLHKLLPLLLIISFAWVELFSAYSSSAFSFYGLSGIDLVTPFSEYLITNILIFACVEWLYFEITFYLYKIVIGFSVFSYTIPKELLNNKGRLFMVIRNIIWGALNALLFFVPFIANYLLIIELLLDIGIFLFFVSEVMKETVDVMIKPNVFKILTVGFLLIKGLSLLGFVLEVI